ERFALPGSAYRTEIDRMLSGKVMVAEFSFSFSGVLRGLRDDYVAGYVTTAEEIIHGDVFEDFLEMAEHLLTAKYPLPAAVLAGAVLEEHVRKLCVRNNVPVSDAKGRAKSVETMNQDLTKAGVYTKPVQMNVTAWYATRTSAAHNKSDFDPALVPSMIRDVRD